MTYTRVLKRKENLKNNRGIAVINLIVILGFVILAAIFLIESDNLVGKNYQLRSYEKQLKEHEDLVQKLQIKQTEQSSFISLKEAAKNFNLVAVDKVKYLEAPQTSVALSGQLFQP